MGIGQLAFPMRLPKHRDLYLVTLCDVERFLKKSDRFAVGEVEHGLFACLLQILHRFLRVLRILPVMRRALRSLEKDTSMDVQYSCHMATD